MKAVTAQSILILICTLFTSNIAEVVIKGDISNLVFDKSANPYIIKESITIPVGKKVTIAPGCVILFNQFCGLEVKGRLVIEGTESEPVVFSAINDSRFNPGSTAQAQPFDWNGITMDWFSTGSIINNLVLQYSVYGIKSQTEALILKDCRFTNNGQYNFTINDRMQQVEENQPLSWQPPPEVTMFTADQPEENLRALTQRLLLSMAYQGADDKQSVAIIPFFTPDQPNQQLGRGVSEFIVGSMVENPNLTVATRSDMQKALAHSNSGVAPNPLTVGNALNARYVVSGTVTPDRNNYLVNCKMIETSSARVITEASARLNEKPLAAFTQEVLGERNKISSTLFRSALIPGWGQYYADNNIRGTLSLGAFYTSVGFTVAEFLSASNAKQDYDKRIALYNTNSGKQQLKTEFAITGGDSTNTAGFNLWRSNREHEFKKRFDTKMERAMLYTAIAGGIWAVNLLDATIAGMQMKNRVKLYFSGSSTGVESSIVMNF